MEQVFGGELLAVVSEGEGTGTKKGGIRFVDSRRVFLFAVRESDAALRELMGRTEEHRKYPLKSEIELPRRRRKSCRKQASEEVQRTRLDIETKRTMELS